MASGWNLWVWLECIVWLVGVVVRRYIDILIILLHCIPYSTCICSFFAATSVLLCSYFKCIFVLVYVIFVQYSKR